jgi:hypothetical protein
VAHREAISWRRFIPRIVSSRPRGGADLAIDQTDVPADAPRVAQQQLLAERRERLLACAHRAHETSARENSRKLKPPNAAAYWSCHPPLIRDLALDTVRQARDLMCREPAVRQHREAATTAVTSADEPPRPLPGGASLSIGDRHPS